MDDIHDFDDTVVAVVSGEEAAESAVTELTAAGYDVEVLRGDEGKEHLDPAGESGPIATVKRLLNAFGDQYRVLDRLHAELDAGKTVTSVDADPDIAEDAARILREHGGEFVWEFGTWTYAPAGD